MIESILLTVRFAVIVVVLQIGMASSFFSIEESSLLWSQEFEGTTIDESIWNYDFGAHGWGNQELQEYVRDAATIEDGVLKITATKHVNVSDNKISFRSARLNTLGKFSFLYGTFEAMVSFPDLAHGLWPAVWFLGEGFPQVPWPDCGEIDLVEMGSAGSIANGTVNRRVGSAAHWKANGQYAYYGLELDTPNNLNDGQIHNFTMTWTPFMIETFVDGQWIWAFDISNPQNFDGEEYHRPFSVVVNMAIGGAYTQFFSAQDVTANFPAEMKIASIRVYRNEYTVETTVDTDAPSFAPSEMLCLVIGEKCNVDQDCCSDECKGRGRNKVCK
jgi:beta-glucanase (GH16 family)